MPTRKNNATTEAQSERRWIEASQKDPAAFEPLFNKYHDPIFNYVLRRTCNVALAQDITAHTFLKALQHIQRYRWQGITFSSWLYRIATNEINLNYRKLKRLVPLTSTQVNNVQDDRSSDTALVEIEESMLKNERFRRIHSALSKLKVKYQAVVSLRYFEDKSIKEIAEILEMPENTVKTHIRRALFQLRELL